MTVATGLRDARGGGIRTSRCRRRLAMVVLAAGCGRSAVGGEAPRAPQTNGSAFSFAVYGDSRSMMVLPDSAGQEAEAREEMVDMFALAVPVKAARQMVKKHVTLTYDPPK